MKKKRMSDFRARKRKEMKLNKKKLADIVDQGMTHDGQFFSLLAECRRVDGDEGLVFDHLGKWLVEEVTADKGWVAGSHKDHTLFVHKESQRTYYVQPIGHPDPTMPEGMNVWDFKINLHLKEDFIKHFLDYGKKKVTEE